MEPTPDLSIKAYWQTLRRDMFHIVGSVLDRARRQLHFWILALLIGIAAGCAAFGFRWGISWIQTTVYSADDLTTSLSAPYQLLAAPSTANRFAGFHAENATERLTDMRFSGSSWNGNFWALEFLPFPPPSVVLPAGPWRLVPPRTQAGYRTRRAGLSVVNATGGTDHVVFVPTENSL